MDIHTAARDGNLELLNKLLLEGQANARTKLGSTPLHFAVAGNKPLAVLLLIENGADINAANIFGTTPLHWASKQNEVEIIRILIENGASKTRTDHFGQTPKDRECKNNDYLTATSHSQRYIRHKNKQSNPLARY